MMVLILSLCIVDSLGNIYLSNCCVEFRLLKGSKIAFEDTGILRYPFKFFLLSVVEDSGTESDSFTFRLRVGNMHPSLLIEFKTRFGIELMRSADWGFKVLIGIANVPLLVSVYNNLLIKVFWIAKCLISSMEDRLHELEI